MSRPKPSYKVVVPKRGSENDPETSTFAVPGSIAVARQRRKSKREQAFNSSQIQTSGLTEWNKPRGQIDEIKGDPRRSLAALASQYKPPLDNENGNAWSDQVEQRLVDQEEREDELKGLLREVYGLEDDMRPLPVSDPDPALNLAPIVEGLFYLSSTPRNTHLCVNFTSGQLVQETDHFTASLPASPLSSPRLLNAKANEFQPIPRPFSAAATYPHFPSSYTSPSNSSYTASSLFSLRANTPSPDMWATQTTVSHGTPLHSSHRPKDLHDEEDDPFDPFSSNTTGKKGNGSNGNMISNPLVADNEHLAKTLKIKNKRSQSETLPQAPQTSGANARKRPRLAIVFPYENGMYLDVEVQGIGTVFASAKPP
ncbi:hypothetical protein D9613_012194 [Agrocybe pediades]|uniref:Uncharacterized protein n=1 Tax=Agrocybe pediades TaxID=84607 RepID=A0A8H4R485_9AGAR|nr:hypothetical protein D9613_012194 [Agrocybe pediades]